MERVMRQLPPLSALATFECVARAGGITAAAAELGMTPGAVSKQIIKLERWFGCALFQRAARRLWTPSRPPAGRAPGDPPTPCASAPPNLHGILAGTPARPVPAAPSAYWYPNR